VDYVKVKTQAELDKVAPGDVPVITGNGRFELCTNRTVRVEGSSTPTIETWGSSTPTIETWESSTPTIVTRESSTLIGRVGKFSMVSVLQHDQSNVKLPGAVLLRTPESIETVEDWIDYYGCEQAKRGSVVVFKCVDDTLRSHYKTLYEVGEEVKCADWSSAPECGGGLHFSPSPSAAQRYSNGGSRFLACSVRVKDIVLLGDKLKTPSCKVLYEVDWDGKRVGVEAA
jgi:hypothetical protein